MELENRYLKNLNCVTKATQTPITSLARESYANPPQTSTSVPIKHWTIAIRMRNVQIWGDDSHAPVILGTLEMEHIAQVNGDFYHIHHRSPLAFRSSTHSLFLPSSSPSLVFSSSLLLSLQYHHHHLHRNDHIADEPPCVLSIIEYRKDGAWCNLCTTAGGSGVGKDVLCPL